MIIRSGLIFFICIARLIEEVPIIDFSGSSLIFEFIFETIALVVNVKNININKVIRKLNHTKTFLETECERIFLNALDGSCQTPVGGYAILKKINNKDKIIFNFIAFSQDGARCVKDKICLDIKNFKSESYKLGVKIKNQIR